MIFLDNKYTDYYYRIIKNAQASSRPKEDSESHHIIPESFFKVRGRSGRKGWLEGNPDDPTNKVLLSMREHYICHLLLVKMCITTEAHSKMAKALNRVVAGKDGLILSSRMYAIVKKELRKAQSGEGNPFHGRTHTKESNDARSKALTGLKRSPESKKNYSAAKEGDKNPGAKTVTCPKCGTTGKAGGMRKHHFEHCKDHLVYTFRHKDGHTFTGTRKSFVNACLGGIGFSNVGDLIYNRAQSVKGWVLVSS